MTSAVGPMNQEVSAGRRASYNTRLTLFSFKSTQKLTDRLETTAPPSSVRLLLWAPQRAGGGGLVEAGSKVRGESGDH